MGGEVNFMKPCSSKIQCEHICYHKAWPKKKIPLMVCMYVCTYIHTVTVFKNTHDVRCMIHAYLKYFIYLLIIEYCMDYCVLYITCIRWKVEIMHIYY